MEINEYGGSLSLQEDWRCHSDREFVTILSLKLRNGGRSMYSQVEKAEREAQ